MKTTQFPAVSKNGVHLAFIFLFALVCIIGVCIGGTSLAIDLQKPSAPTVPAPKQGIGESSQPCNMYVQYWYFVSFGTQTDIAWDNRCSSQYPEVSIELVRNQQTVKVITPRTANDGKFEWLVQEDPAVQNGDGYTIRVTASVKNKAFGESNPFTIWRTPDLGLKKVTLQALSVTPNGDEAKITIIAENFTPYPLNQQGKLILDTYGSGQLHEKTFSSVAPNGTVVLEYMTTFPAGTINKYLQDGKFPRKPAGTGSAEMVAKIEYIGIGNEAYTRAKVDRNWDNNFKSLDELD